MEHLPQRATDSRMPRSSHICAADNNGNHDPRLLYTVVLGSSRAHYITPRKDARDDVIAVDVRRNARGWEKAVRVKEMP